MLKERLDFKFTRKLFTLIPHGLSDCLKKVLTLNFDETPDYNYYRETIKACLNKSLRDTQQVVFSSNSSVERLMMRDFEWLEKVQKKQSKYIQSSQRAY